MVHVGKYTLHRSYKVGPYDRYKSSEHNLYKWPENKWVTGVISPYL